MIMIQPDDGMGVIKTVGRGRWSLADVDAYHAQLSQRVKAMRLDERPVRILTDVTEAEVQQPDIEARINAHAKTLYQVGDRKALVVKNNLLKSHVRPLIIDEGTAIFCSLEAAKMWLCAHDYAMIA